MRVPEAADAIEAVREAFGWRDVGVRRFSNGLAFYVFDVTATEGRCVVRLGRPEQRQTLKDSNVLAATLRPLGVPLPRLLHDGTEASLPFAILERLEGMDLGDVFAELTPMQRRGVAIRVAEAQQAVGRLGPGVRFGYATSAEAARHGDWAAVVRASIARAQQRIAANGLFPDDPAERLLDIFERFVPLLCAIAPMPFLHDTTTKNVIVSDAGVFSGIVDVDDLCFGDPRYAAALTAVALTTRGYDLDYVDTWLSAMGQERDALFELYVAVFLLDFMAEHGMAFNGNMTPSRAEDRQHLLRLFEQSVGALL